MEINRIAKLRNKKVKVGVRLNPNTDAKTFPKTTWEICPFLKDRTKIKIPFRLIQLILGNICLTINNFRDLSTFENF